MKEHNPVLMKITFYVDDEDTNIVDFNAKKTALTLLFRKISKT